MNERLHPTLDDSREAGEDRPAASLAPVLLALASHLSTWVDGAVRRSGGVGVADYRVLTFLHDAAGRPTEPWELTARLQMSPAQITNVVDRLVARGLVNRRVHPQDGRRRWIRLTPSGCEHIEDLAREVRILEERLMEDFLAPVERAQLGVMLARLDVATRTAGPRAAGGRVRG